MKALSRLKNRWHLLDSICLAVHEWKFGKAYTEIDYKRTKVIDALKQFK